MRTALLSRTGQPSAGPSATPRQAIPTIRFISATPSTHEHSQPQIDVNMDAYPGPYNPAVPFASAPAPPSSPLAPRLDAASPRKRLVPKKSKMGLLSGSTKTKEKPKVSKDFSDVVRRVGASGGTSAKSSGRGGFEIYVDHCEDEDAELVVVKKKKSRMGLGGVGWGTLGEVTNTNVTKENRPAGAQTGAGKPESTLKVPKGDENANCKWWSIGRGRKDIKEKEKTQVRSKTPEPFAKPTEPESRARFNSLDSGRLFSLSFAPPPEQSAAPSDPLQDSPRRQPPRQRSGTLSSLSTLLNVPGSENGDGGRLAPERTASGSIAVRAMRSMRSLAKMKSWANLGPEKEGNNGDAQDTNDTNVNAKKNTITKTLTTVTSKTKEKKSKKSKEKPGTQRFSSSSFEAGAPSPALSPVGHFPTEAAPTISKKPSKLAIGLGLPSSLRLATTIRPSRLSSTSSAEPPTPISGPFPLQQNRLSAGSAHLVMGPNGRPVSGVSTRSGSSQGSSLRPPSTASNYSGASVSQFSARSPRSSSSSVVSVRWDEEGISNVKAVQRRERETKRERDRQNGKESKHSLEGRRRTAIADIFPEVRAASSASRRSSSASERPGQPIVTIEEATTDGHGSDNDAPIMETPVKKARPRPMSEQMLGKSRPRPIVDDADGVLDILDAATNDLASLINRLDLEATPASTKGSPRRLRKSPSSSSMSMLGDDSPLKGHMKYTFDKKTDAPLLSEYPGTTGSIASLKAYAKMQLQPKAPAHPAVPPTRQQGLNPDAARRLIGQQIVPWSELDWQVSPKKPTIRPKGFRPTHKRSPTPSPEMDTGPVFQPLRPAAKMRASSIENIPSVGSTPVPAMDTSDPSASTFGSETKRLSKLGFRSSDDLGDNESTPPSPSPPMRRKGRHSRKSSVLSVMCDNGISLAPDALKSLGLGGTMGGPEPEVDPEDPDSDIPEELRAIIAGQSDDEYTQAFEDTLSMKPRSRAPSPGLPPLAALPEPESEPEPEFDSAPVFRATLLDEEANQADIDEGDASASEDDTNSTNKSFDFTGELQKLSESGGSDRLSFVEQIETAFRTPARIDLGFELSQKLFVRNESPPPVPPLPAMYRRTPDEDLVPRSVSDQNTSTLDLEHSEEPSFRHSGVSDTLDHLIAECEEDFCRQFNPDTSMSSTRSAASDGKLNTSFSFGGKPSPNTVQPSPRPVRPLTLSDIIPPLSHSRNPSESSMPEGDSSIIRSILNHAYQDDTSVINSILAQAQDVPRPRVDSDSSSKRFSRDAGEASQTSSDSRPVSMASFTGFDSFDEVRRGFEFHPNRPAFYPPPGVSNHKKFESIYSIASVSDYGSVINSGQFDPFGYAGGVIRPISDDMSSSVGNVDDTFSFLKRDPARKRVDSDASSFYFRPGQRRGHRRNESNFSVASNAPPISLYNRSYGAHRRNDSSGSMSSIAHSYAMHGGPGARNSWARHARDQSRDSIFSDMSVVNMGRPGLGDKMFNMDYGMPLTAITASPTGSVFSQEQSQPFQREQPTNFDSIMDSDPRTETDSIFEVTGNRTSVASDPFMFDPSVSNADPFLRLRQFRPISMMSMSSVHTAARDDDTMMSIAGGGHIRRRSIDRNIRDSPCANMGRKKQTALQFLGRVLQFEQGPDELPSLEANRISKISPEKVIVEKPSIASTSSYQFGQDRMIMAGKGLLQRQSLEESVLMAQGEDIIASLENTRVFTRPSRTGRSRSSTITTSSGAETPPLSASDSSSVSSGSQSSIDLGHLNTLLTGAMQPSSGIARARTSRARPRGAGHRRRYSAGRSRSSVYETIQEESCVFSSSPSPEKLSLPDATEKFNSTASVHNDTVIIVDPETASMEEDWTDEHGIVSLRKYYALRDEVQVTVTESKRAWTDTPFSLFAIQSFDPPASRGGMEAMLEHSQKNYGPLPSELRPHRIRSRTSSRATPYPTRGRLISLTSEQQPEMEGKPFASPEDDEHSASSLVLREISINPNISVFSLPPAASADGSAFSPFALQLERSKEEKIGFARPRVSSGARRSALGWSKRPMAKAKASNDKENVVSPGVTMYTPSDSLRLSRPRPKGRPTPARVPVPKA